MSLRHLFLLETLQWKGLDILICTGRVSVPNSISMSVCRTVSEIFTVKEWHDLETGGRCHSRSLKIAPFDGSYTTFCRFAIAQLYVVPF